MIRQTPKMRKQIFKFSKWLEMVENEELMKTTQSPIVPHDPPNAEVIEGPGGLEIELYGRSK